MTPSAIYRKTMIFNWINLGIGMLTVLLSCIVIGATWLILSKISLTLLTQIAIVCAAFLVITTLYFIIMGKLGYTNKMGQLAIIERAQKGLDIPPNPIEFSKNIVSERFGNNRQFYKFSRDIRIAISQIVRIFARGFSLDTSQNDIHKTRYVSILFAHGAISRADACCIAYALRQNDYEINAACVDAITILAQKWNAFQNRALKLGLLVLLLCILLCAIFFLPGLAIAQSLSINSMPWFGMSILLAVTFKIAFFDSYILTKIVCEFLEIAQNTQINADNYSKLDNWSKIYAKMRKNAKQAAIDSDADLSGAPRHHTNKDDIPQPENITANKDDIPQPENITAIQDSDKTTPAPQQ